MTLSNLIRKRDTVSIATAISAISATHGDGEASTVAGIATVAVANPTSGIAARLAASDETAIRAWLALIEESDPATIAEVIGQCQRDAEARDYFTGRAAAELPKVAVGTPVTQRPPHRSVRAELPHTAPASGHDAKRSGGYGCTRRG